MRLSETNKHYDIESNFFKSFLDKSYMKYSSGLFFNHEPLEVAARNMLDSHISFLKNFIAPRILEIGPGWGAFLKRLRELNINCSYSTVNPSGAQNDFIRTNIDPTAYIINNTFENTQLTRESFDVIYFIGSFCHMRDLDKLLPKLYQLLSSEGRVVIEDVFFLNEDLYNQHYSRPETHFVQKEVFGYSHIPFLSRFIELAFANGLHISSLTDHSKGYSKSIRCWLEQIRVSSHPKAPEFVKYLEIAQRGWGYTTGNYLIELCKKDIF